MSWTKMNPDEKETIFQSESVDPLQISIDLKTLTDRMIENREDDNATMATQFLFDVNATNGFIRITWWNNETSVYAGDWVYYLELKTLWDGEDAFQFDDVCRLALFHFTEDYMLTDEGGSVYNVFLKTELCEMEEVLV